LLGWVVAAAALGVAGCGRTEAPTPRPAGGAAAPVRFRPPADGLLTGRHIDLYIRVRRAARGRSDSDAARAIAVDPEEFAWVRARVVEALVLLDARRVREEAAQTYARVIASLHETRKRVRDPATARAIEGEIGALERERAAAQRSETPPPAAAENARRLAARRAEVENPGS
jgi:hypothetical protein